MAFASNVKNMSRILIVSADTVDENMAGMGVRYWELAHALAKSCQVTLAVPNPTALSSRDVEIAVFDLAAGDLRLWAARADVIVLEGPVLHFHPYLRQLNTPLAVDLYVPNLLESLVWHDQDDWDKWIPQYEEYLRVQGELIREGDYFFCASERQRDYWLGWLHALKRINPHTFHQDPMLRRLIDVVPFGIPTMGPVAGPPVLKGVHEGISVADKLILWTGGLWDWLDPLTLIEAMAALAPSRPDLKLFFMGTRHPNSGVTGMTMQDRTIELSRTRGLFGRTVFFGDWVPYSERVRYLLEADLAVVSHPEHIETHFAYRTRVLDCIWARLPVVITQGGTISTLVQEYRLGEVVPSKNPRVLADAIIKTLAVGRQSFSAGFDAARESITWDRAIDPLLQFCVHPVRSPDRDLYLTEAERQSRARDAHLEQVIRDKDAFLEQVVKDKDAFLEQVVAGKDAELRKLHDSLPIRGYLKLKQLLGLP